MGRACRTAAGLGQCPARRTGTGDITGKRYRSRDGAGSGWGSDPRISRKTGLGLAFRSGNAGAHRLSSRPQHPAPQGFSLVSAGRGPRPRRPSPRKVGPHGTCDGALPSCAITRRCKGWQPRFGAPGLGVGGIQPDQGAQRHAVHIDRNGAPRRRGHPGRHWPDSRSVSASSGSRPPGVGTHHSQRGPGFAQPNCRIAGHEACSSGERAPGPPASGPPIGRVDRCLAAKASRTLAWPLAIWSIGGRFIQQAHRGQLPCT